LISPQTLDALNEVRPGLLQVVGDTNLLCALETQMFMMPTAVTMTIAATRMYRGLSDFCFHTDVCVILPSIIPLAHCSRCNNSIISSGGVYRSAHAAPPRTTLAISTHGKLEAAVRTTTLSSLRDKDAPFVTTEGQRGDKPLELKLHGDAESKA
jgi:hypothetical protein